MSLSLDLPLVPLVEYLFSNKTAILNKVAILDEDHGIQVTYGELITRVQKVAFSLREKGVGVGYMVCLFGKNSIDWVIVYLAVMSLGGIITTVNPSYTAHELKYQLLDSQSKMIATEQEFLPKTIEAAEASGVVREIILIDLPSSNQISQIPKSKTLPITKLELLIGQKQIDFGKVNLNPKEDLCCLPYSSGTTGLPKGVCLTHYNVTSSLEIAGNGFSPLEMSDVLLCSLPLFHIYGMNVILNHSLKRGSTLILMRQFKLEKYLETIEKRRVTLAFCVPPMMVAMAKVPWTRKFDISSLKLITSGAAPLGSDVEKTLAGKTGGVAVRQGYGMTETAGVAAANPRDRIKQGSIGLFAEGFEVKIIDPETGKEVKRNQPGELCMRSACVMKGYWNKAEATKNTIDSEGFLHTGDVAIVDDDGYYFIVDRLKELIKHKGFQVAPAELEALLLTHPAIADAAVIGVNVNDGNDELPKAFVVKKPNQDQLTEKMIHEFVNTKVAHYKNNSN
eukprot:TRINITY_DN4010_c0_g2_i1.p1 TRINITY_DN4010_c0_g2~~TRINITY_DN4010_c0_g2_i1.p1  ORF type:complete len:507 (+),score=152.85 TRINITY_DN4010_c0_g2_i1:35-1555(+)